MIFRRPTHPIPFPARPHAVIAGGLAVCALLASAGAAEARWVIKGAGFGHGIGLSQ